MTRLCEDDEGAMSGRPRCGITASAVVLSVVSLVPVDQEATHYAADIAASGMSGSSVDASQDDVGDILNPHSDLVFNATGTTSCRDCHAPMKGATRHPAVLDNAAVRGLIAKGKGAHGPGRFADCFRCHSGGRQGVEKYSDG
jgi:hypothetical protein